MNLPIPPTVPYSIFLTLVFGVGLLRAAPDEGTLKVLKEREEKTLKVYQKVAPTVVALLSARSMQEGTGSGVIVSKDGLILTAWHVVDATGDDIIVMLSDGQRRKGKALGANKNRDAAMVRIVPEKEESFPFVEIAPSGSTELGDWCLAMGHPGGYDPLRPAPLRLGRILQQQGKNLLVSDCTLAGGDSGGPLFDLDGRLIGIHSSISGSLAHNMHVAAHVYHQDWKRMLEKERWGELKSLFSEPLPGYEDQLGAGNNRAVLGAKLDRRAQDGVLARDVIEGSPAQQGGMKAGDVIVKFDGKAIVEYADLHSSLSRAEPGSRVKIVVNRKGEKVELDVELGSRADFGR